MGSTPVGPLGSGIGGGVELTLSNLVRGLEARGHHIEVMAPAGSLHIGSVTHQISGALQPSAQFIDRRHVTDFGRDGVLWRMWDFAREHEQNFDVVLNMAYDAVPFECSSQFSIPVKHLVSMSSISDQMDRVVVTEAALRPGSIAMHSAAQSSTFVGLANCVIVGSGVDLQRYLLVETVPHDAPLGFIGRIAPEKGLRDAVEIASRTGRELKVWGLLQDGQCWDDAVGSFSEARVTYEGFLPNDKLLSVIGQCSAVVMTPKWVEAFGNVAIEALACGVPVIAYDRGGPAEIVDHGVTGFIVPADNIDAASDAVARVGTISRRACRHHVEKNYSLDAFASRVEQWLIG